MILPMILGRELMRRFIEAADRGQSTLLPECLDDFIDQGNPVRVIDVRPLVGSTDAKSWPRSPVITAEHVKEFEKKFA